MGNTCCCQGSTKEESSTKKESNTKHESSAKNEFINTKNESIAIAKNEFINTKNESIAKNEFNTQNESNTVLSHSPVPSDTILKIANGESVSKSNTLNIHNLGDDRSVRDLYNFGRRLGKGQYGKIFLCEKNETKYACKSIEIDKKKWDENEKYVKREIEIMHRLAGKQNVISIKEAYKDAKGIHIIMELCEGGELFDGILRLPQQDYTERKVAKLIRMIIESVEVCHSFGVMHRDIKPENFVFDKDALLKIIDFGFSTFFEPGQKFSERVYSRCYAAPEVLKECYGPEADVWSAGVILYIMLSGKAPFWAASKEMLHEQILNHELDFSLDIWRSISKEAKDLVRQMLDKDPKKRISASAVLEHPWVKADGVAVNKPLDSAVLRGLKQFFAISELQKMATRVLAESLSEEVIAGLNEMFMTMDTNKIGFLTFEELKAGVKRYGDNRNESEIFHLMKAVVLEKRETITYAEFLAAALHNKMDGVFSDLAQIKERKELLSAAFSFFDRDGNGYITPDELQEACKVFSIEEDCEEIMQEVDKNNDGRIDYMEFVALMQKGIVAGPATMG